MADRTFNTLFMISSVDGKISTGDVDSRDVDKDFPNIREIAKGLGQYYDLERRTDLHSLNTGRVMAKIGMNEMKKDIRKLPVSFIIVDNKPYLNKRGLDNLIKKSKRLYLVTHNKKHPAFQIKEDNLEIIYYKNKLNFTDLFTKLKQEYGIERVTIQSSGTLNSVLLRSGLIDELSLVIAPALIGGKATPSIIDGESLRSGAELDKIRPLRLKEVKKLKHSYLHLTYRVVNK